MNLRCIRARDEALPPTRRLGELSQHFFGLLAAWFHGSHRLPEWHCSFERVSILSPARSLICLRLIAQGGACFSHRLPWAMVVRASSPLTATLVSVAATRGSFLHEQPPICDALRIANERRHRQLLRRARHTEQFQAGFVRQAVALASVHRLVRPH